MAPRLRISAGPAADQLTTLAVNHDLAPGVIDTESFQGRVTVRVKGFEGQEPPEVDGKSTTTYFDEPYGSTMTYSIQVQGRFCSAVNTDDLVFGNTFDQPIRDSLPYGTSLALRFVRLVDPNMTHDLHADQPWAFSPLLATVFRAQATRAPEGTFAKCASVDALFRSPEFPPFPSPDGSGEPFVREDLTPLFFSAAGDAHGQLVAATGADQATAESMDMQKDPQANTARAAWLSHETNRKNLVVTPDDVLTVDFCNGYIDFNTLHLVLPFAGTLSFDLQKYWDGQPVRYVCKNRKSSEVYFVVHR
ncbi:hypothetical protein MSPP1_002678 [Malassezia sp. CBS 17886]|nr:hypothetical protein MSPP1_002678 [Malassezia sp. CBS 17886]